jgi:hypothetical protein
MLGVGKCTFCESQAVAWMWVGLVWPNGVTTAAANLVCRYHAELFTGTSQGGGEAQRS